MGALESDRTGPLDVNVFQDSTRVAAREQAVLLNIRCMALWAGICLLVFLAYLLDLPSLVCRLVYEPSGYKTQFFFTAADFSAGSRILMLGAGIWFALYAALAVVLQSAGDDREIWLHSFKERRLPDPRTLMKLLFPFAVAYLLLFALRVDTFVRVTDKGMAVNRPYTLGETWYSWCDILRITMRRSEPLSGRTKTVCNVYTSDGTRFTLRGRLPEAANVELAGQHISLQSGVPIYSLSSGITLVPKTSGG